MTTSAERLILVNENDSIVGHGEKLWVHQQGLLHRAFSIVVFDDTGRVLLQRRALHKYHCGGLWTNTCCSHQLAGETMEACLHARLSFEMGFDCALAHHHTFTYRAVFPESGLIEHEVDHVYTGYFSGEPRPNPEEVMDYRWESPPDLRNQMRQEPDRFTPWFKQIIERL